MFALMRPSAKQEFRGRRSRTEFGNERIENMETKTRDKGVEVKKAGGLSKPISANEGKADRPVSCATGGLTALARHGVRRIIYPITSL